MYASSLAEQRGCSSGLRYIDSQRTSQTNPSDPIRKKAHRQPQRSEIQGTRSGATIAPRFVPALKIPVASARSFFGNHSLTAFRLAGNTPDSPNPNANRAARTPPREPAIPWAIEARLHVTIARA